MAYEVSYIEILSKPSDFKICDKCGRINWYENEVCIDCGNDDFRDDQKEVEIAVDKEIFFYTESEGYTEEQAENIIVEV